MKMAFNRKNRAYQLRLALLQSDTPASAHTGGRLSSLGSGGGRLSRYSGRDPGSAGRLPSTPSSSVRTTGSRRRPHRLPELGETEAPPVADKKNLVTVTNLRLGTSTPLPPIPAGTQREEVDPAVTRGRPPGPAPPPREALEQQQRHLRADLHTPRALGDPALEALLLQQLGDVTVQWVHHSQSAADLVRAAALYNTALLGCGEDDDQKIRVRSRLIEAERQLLQRCSCCTAVVVEKYLAMDTGARDNRRLAQVRREVRESLRTAQGCLERARGEGEEGSEGQQEAVGEFVEEMGAVSRAVHKAVVDVLQHMVTTCKAVLGEPPCRYAVLAVGPLVAGWGDPYHMPLEYVILIGDDTKSRNVEYFHDFCHYMHLKVLNLGETPLFRCGVRTFDDEHNELFECFHDNQPRRGLHLDLSGHGTAVTPLMCVDGDRLLPHAPGRTPAFIGSPWRLAGQVDAGNAGGTLTYDLAHKMTHFALVDGDKALVEDYRTELTHLLQRPDDQGGEYRLTLSSDWLMSALQEPEPVAISNNGLSSLRRRQLGRDLGLIGQMAGALKVNHGVRSVHVWDVMDSLVKRGALTAEGADNLKYAQALSYYFSLKASYNASRSKPLRQSDSDTPLTDQMMQACLVDGLTLEESALTSWAVQQYYRVVVPCWTCLYQRAASYGTLSLHDCLLVNDNPKVQALAYDRLGDPAGALRVLGAELLEVLGLSGPPQPVLLHDLYTLQALEHLCVGQLREARTCLNRAMDLKEHIRDPPAKSRAFADTWHHFGLLQLVSGRWDKALGQLTEGTGLAKELLPAAGDQRRLQDAYEAGVYENIGHVQTALGMLGGALKSYGISLRYREELQPGDLLTETSRDLHYHMGTLHLTLANHDSALVCLGEALSVQCHLSGRAARPGLWDALIMVQLARTHDRMGNLALGASYRLQARRVGHSLCELLGLTADAASVDLHFESVASLDVLYELAKCLLYTGDTKLALVLLDSIQTQLQPSSDQTKDACAALVDLPHVLLCKGEALTALEDHERALGCYTELADLCERTYTERSRPTHLVASCHRHLGAGLVRAGRYEEASRRFDVALELYRFCYGDVPSHPDVCDILRLRGLCLRGAGEYAESVRTLQECVALEKEASGSATTRVAGALYETGLTYFAEGLYESAMTYFEQSMEVYRKLDLRGDTCVEEVPKLYVGRAQCHVALGRIAQAEKCWERALTKARAVLQREPARLTAFCKLLKLGADFYHQVERWDHAVRLRSEVLTLLIEKGELKEDSPEVCSVIFALGRDLSASGKTDEAMKAFEKAISLRRQHDLDDEGSLELASWLSEVGQEYAKSGQQERASECHLESLYLKKQVLGQGMVDEDVISSLETIAGVHEKRGELKQALALRKQSLVKNIQLHGADASAALVDTVERVAAAFQRLGEYSSALRHWQDALHLRERLDAAERPENDPVHVHHEYGRCYEGLKQYERAIEQYQRSLGLLRADGTGSNKDLMVAVTVGDIGKALNSLGRSQEAVEHLMTASSALREPRDAQEDPRDAQHHLASVLSHLGLAYETCGQVGPAADCYTEAVALFKDLSGTDPCRPRADCLRALGKLSCASPDGQGAKLLEEALAEYRRLTPPGSGSPEVASTLEDLAGAYSDMGNDGLTLRYLTEALQVLRQVHGHKRPHLQVARCLGGVAAVCGRAGRHDDTVAYARQALAMYTAILPETADHPELVTLHELLGDCFWAQGRYEECLVHYKKASQICLYLHNGDALHTDVAGVMSKLQGVKQHLGRNH